MGFGRTWIRNALTLGLMGFAVACGDVNSQFDDSVAVEGAEQADSQEIVGGTTTSDYPAVGFLMSNGRMFCTGTVVEKRKVLTAAHCLEGQSASGLRFGFGPDATKPTSSIAVASISYHPQYNSQIFTNDIGYVILASDAPVEPMGLVQKIDNTWVGKKLLYVGYGFSNGAAQTGIGVKRQVEMATSKVESTFFYYQTPGKSTCMGDSGGPAFFRDASGKLLIAGVTSHGDRYCQSWGADTRVDLYASYLKIAPPVAPPVVPEVPSTPDTACGAETFEGRCSGTTVVWCEDKAIHKTNCRTLGAKCGFIEEDKYFGCVR